MNNLSYHYDQHGHLMGAFPCQLDPVETKNRGEDVYLIPASATRIVPPKEEAGKIAVWTGKSWEKKNDTRGFWYDTKTGEQVFIDKAGELIVGLTRKEPPVDKRRVYEKSSDSWRIRDWSEMPEEDQREAYERLVAKKIREKFSPDQEQAIKSDALAGDTERLTDFLAWRDECKTKARAEIYG